MAAIAKPSTGSLNWDTATDALFDAVNAAGGDTLAAAVAAKIAKFSITAVKTANYTAAAGEFVPVDTTSGNVTVTFPTAPADGTQVGVKHVIRGGTNTVGLTLGGSDKFNTAAGSTSGTLTVLAQGAIFTYKASTSIWYVTAADVPLSQLDARFLAKPTTPATTSQVVVDNTGAVTTRPLPDVQVFTTSGTWTKPAGATFVQAFCVGAGSGGGSGARRASGTASSGGAGGGGGGWSTGTFRAADLSSTETVTVGAGGAGATAITANDTNGNNGSGGGNSQFGSTTKTVRANGAPAGGAGGNAGGSAVAAGGARGTVAGGGGGGGTSGAAGVAAGNVSASSGGGGGGGVTATPTFTAGGSGGVTLAVSDLAASGGATDGAAGGAGIAVTASTSFGGGGGGGGASSVLTAGGTGGAGGAYGAGGGGGGSSINGSNSGAGGAGANGIVVVIST